MIDGPSKPRKRRKRIHGKDTVKVRVIIMPEARHEGRIVLPTREEIFRFR